MSEPFLGEIRIVAFTFAPSGWALCNGQLLPLSQNTALFSLLGTIYGGDGRTTFALPDFRGKAPMHWGLGPGLAVRQIGESAGVETVPLGASQIPAHTHTVNVANQEANTRSPSGAFPATSEEDDSFRNGTTGNMASAALAPSGADLAHNNMQPYLVMNFIIALTGLFPSRG